MSRAGVAALLVGIGLTASAGDFAVHVPVIQKISGSFYVKGVLDERFEAEFLVDTGSSYVAVNRKLFAHLKQNGGVSFVKDVAGVMANGRREVVGIYRIARFRLGSECELGSIEIAVLPRGSRNILGLNALGKTAPFALYMSPPLLALTQCGRHDTIASID